MGLGIDKLGLNCYSITHMCKRVKILITGACCVTARAVARSLRLSPYFKKANLIGIDICRNLYGVYEGLYARVYRVPRWDDEQYPKAVNQVIVKEGISAAVVIPELEAVYWSVHSLGIPHLSIPPGFCKIAISKERLYQALVHSDLVPEFQILDRQAARSALIGVRFPVWVREFEEGSTSGRGSLIARSPEELVAWFDLRRNMQRAMIASVLPGKNFACFLLFLRGSLLKVGVAERIEYIMSNVALSGITGNTARGRLLNREDISDVSLRAVRHLCAVTGETMNGLVTVDLREDETGRPRVTEINLRPVAFTSAFAQAGFNLSEYQLHCALGQEADVPPEQERRYPGQNIVLRDVDGLPLYVSNPSPVPDALTM